MPSVIDVHPSTERLHALDALRGMPAATSSATRPPASIAMTEQRNAGLDALRAAIVLLVVFHHTAITYGANGLWYYREVMPDGSPGSKLLTLMCSVDQAFFMGLLFLLAGYFLPGSLARHGALGYVKERLVRLGIPILVFGFVIGLATIALGLTAKGIPFTTTLLARWSYGTFAVGPLWFAVALLIFTAGFLAWRSLARPPGSEADTPQPCSFPSNAMLAIAALAIGAAAFALRLAWPVGTTPALDLQLGYFASYVVLFAAGCIGARGQWLSHVPSRQRRLWMIVATIAIAASAVQILGVSTGGTVVYTGTASASPPGGWNVHAATYALWEPLVAWGVILGLVHLFEQRFVALGPAWSALARRSYAIYVIHPPVVVGVALAWRDVSAPHLAKFTITGTLATLACFWIAGLLLRIPGINRVL
jgi:peptidoglycan/LPS O-acetylase OafA/YrhL